MKGGTCLGYLTSIANIQTSGAAVGGRKACIPPNADMNQMVDVFRGYRRDHPERRHLPAANLVAEAFVPPTDDAAQSRSFAAYGRPRSGRRYCEHSGRTKKPARMEGLEP